MLNVGLIIGLYLIISGIVMFFVGFRLLFEKSNET